MLLFDIIIFFMIILYIKGILPAFKNYFKVLKHKVDNATYVVEDIAYGKEDFTMSNKQKIDELIEEINNLQAERDKKMKEVGDLCNIIEEKTQELGKWKEIYFRDWE